MSTQSNPLPEHENLDELYQRAKRAQSLLTEYKIECDNINSSVEIDDEDDDCLDSYPRGEEALQAHQGIQSAKNVLETINRIEKSNNISAEEFNSDMDYIVQQLYEAESWVENFDLNRCAE